MSEEEHNEQPSEGDVSDNDVVDGDDGKEEAEKTHTPPLSPTKQHLQAVQQTPPGSPFKQHIPSSPLPVQHPPSQPAPAQQTLQVQTQPQPQVPQDLVPPYMQQQYGYVPQQQYAPTTATQRTNTQSVSQWATTSSTEKLGTKNNPYPIDEFTRILDRVFLAAVVAGSQGSKHYPIRVLNGNMPYSPNVQVGRDNSSQSPYYYVDCSASIEASKRSSQSLERSGYYELNCEPENVNPNVVEMLTEKLKSLRSVVGEGEIRTPLYKGRESPVRFSCRVFESYAKNKDRESIELYAPISASGGENAVRRVSVDSNEYKRYSGNMRVTGQFSSVTVAGGYIKLVFVARMIILKSVGDRLVGGLKTTSSDIPQGASGDEWNEFVAFCRDTVESGIPVRVLRSTLESGLNAKVAASRDDSTFKNLVSDMNNLNMSSQQHQQQHQQPHQQQSQQLPAAHFQNPYAPTHQYTPLQQQMQQQPLYVPSQQYASVYAPPQQQQQYSPYQQPQGIYQPLNTGGAMPSYNKK
jgi:hypothetical protein